VAKSYLVVQSIPSEENRANLIDQSAASAGARKADAPGSRERGGGDRASGRDAAAPLNVRNLQLSYTIAFQQLWGDVHDFLSRSSVVNCDAVSNPIFHTRFFCLLRLLVVCAPFLCVSCVARAS